MCGLVSFLNCWIVSHRVFSPQLWKFARLERFLALFLGYLPHTASLTDSCLRQRTNSIVLKATPLSNRSLYSKSGNTVRDFILSLETFTLTLQLFTLSIEYPDSTYLMEKHSQAVEALQVTMCYFICAQLPNNKCWLLFPKNS